MHQILVTLGDAGELESGDCYEAFRGFLIEGDPLEGPETLAGRWSG